MENSISSENQGEKPKYRSKTNNQKAPKKKVIFKVGEKVKIVGLNQEVVIVKKERPFENNYTHYEYHVNLAGETVVKVHEDLILPADHYLHKIIEHWKIESLKKRKGYLVLGRIKPEKKIWKGFMGDSQNEVEEIMKEEKDRISFRYFFELSKGSWIPQNLRVQ